MSNLQEVHSRKPPLPFISLWPSALSAYQLMETGGQGNFKVGEAQWSSILMCMCESGVSFLYIHSSLKGQCHEIFVFGF